MKVNFLVVGAQKAGTTALAEFLSQHPDVCVAPGKEVHYFDNDRYFQGVPDHQAYHRHFPNEAGQTAVGEATPIYMYLEEAAPRIQAYNPEMKLIFLLRNPIERAYSHYAMERNRGREPLEFGEAIRAEASRLTALAHLRDECAPSRIHSYVDRGFYSRQITRMLSFFPREQMLFIESDALRHGHAETMARIFKFLGVEPLPIPPRENIHKGSYTSAMSEQDRQHLLEVYRDELTTLEALLGVDLSHWKAAPAQLPAPTSSAAPREHDSRPASLPLIIAGMHRSGTSMTASFVQALGVNIGDKLLRGNRDNKPGYFEDLEFLHLQRHMFSTCCRNEPGWIEVGWTESEYLDEERLRAYVPRAKRLIETRLGNPVWGWKDPRTTILLPFWQQLLPDARYLMVYRRPWDVVDSLFRVNHEVFNEHPEYAIKIWTYYNKRMLQFYRANRDRCVLVSTEGMLQNLDRFVGLLQERCGLTTTAESPEAALASIYDKELLKQLPIEHPLVSFAHHLYPEAIEVLEALEAEADIPSGGYAKAHVQPADQIAHLLYRRGGAQEKQARVAPPSPQPAPQPVHAPRPGEAGLGKPLTAPKVSIVLSVQDGVEHTMLGLQAMVEHTPGERFELIVIDNGSTDGTADLLASLEGDVCVLRNAEKRSVAEAYNQGATAAKGEYLLFLNHGTVPHQGWLEPLIRQLDERSDVGAVGSRLLFPDGTLQHAGVEVIEDRRRGRYLDFRHRFYRCLAHHPEALRRADVQVLTGAALMVRKEAFQQARGFDEGYWNGYEDVDLCLTLGQAGWRLVYEPESVLTYFDSLGGPERYSRARDNIQRMQDRWLGKAKPELIVTADGVEGPPPGGSPVVSGLVSIIVLAQNQLPYNQVCVESLLEHSDRPFELILVDNGSSDGTQDYFAALAAKDDRVRVVHNPQNLGFALGCNQGFGLARGEYVVVLNNETIVPRSWLSRMKAHLDAHPEVGMVGPISNYIGGSQLVSQTPFPNRIESRPEILVFGDQIAQVGAGQGFELNRLIGPCWMMRREVLDKLGGLDPRFALGNFEDDDYCVRLDLAGYKIRVAQDVYVHHFGNRTFAGLGAAEGNSFYDLLLQRNWMLYKAKWGLPANHPPDLRMLVPVAPFHPFEHHVALPAPDSAVWHMPVRGVAESKA